MSRTLIATGHRLPGGNLRIHVRQPATEVQCAWCGLTLREGRRPISHGICQACKAELDPDEKNPATDATVTGPERRSADESPALQPSTPEDRRTA